MKSDSRNDGDLLALTHDPIDTNEIMNHISREDCGANAIFIGTTRSTFESKHVVSLHYEAYTALALKSMSTLTSQIRLKYAQVKSVAIVHRLGQVDVGEASICIAVSAKHRQHALMAVEVLLDCLKTETAIWKKEVYSDGGSMWKQNICGVDATTDSTRKH